MLRRIVLTFCLAPLAATLVAAEAPETDAGATVAEPVPAEAGAEATQPAAATETASTADDPSTFSDKPAAAEGEEVTTTVVRGERFVYSMTLKRAGSSLPGIRCSEGRRTGSHFRHRYCRTDEMAELEREAAQEFLREASRNRGN